MNTTLEPFSGAHFLVAMKIDSNNNQCGQAGKASYQLLYVLLRKRIYEQKVLKSGESSPGFLFALSIKFNIKLTSLPILVLFSCAFDKCKNPIQQWPLIIRHQLPRLCLRRPVPTKSPIPRKPAVTLAQVQ